MKNKKNLSKELEVRYVSIPEVRSEKREDGKEVFLVKGTAVKFNELSRSIGWFREKFSPGAFDDVLEGDTVAVFNHNYDKVLARTISKTLKLTQDEVGLHYEFEAPDNTAGRDLVVSMQRGDIQHSSFSFRASADRWEDDMENGEIRTVDKVDLLRDVSPVVFPAYPQTVSEVAKRSYDEWKQEKETEKKEEQEQREETNEVELENETQAQELELLKLKYKN